MELRFPLKGKHVGSPSSKQPPGTSNDLNNVRPFYDGKTTGGQRPGLSQRYTDKIGTLDNPIVAMCSVTVVD